MDKKVTRRNAVRTITTGTLAAVACTSGAKPSTESVVAKEEKKEMPSVLTVEGLPSSGPMPTSDPFLFCVHHLDDYPEGNARFGPSASLTGRMMGQDFANIDGWNMYHGDVVPGFPRHPHRGFETVTVVKTGLIDHADSLGSAARYGNGDVQWLTAGDGINHAEMFPLLNQSEKNPTDFFQIWLNLPARLKRVTPHFKMLWAEDIPKFEFSDEEKRLTKVTLVAGRYFGKQPPAPPPNSWASQTNAEVGIMTIEIASQGSWTLPAGAEGLNRSLYVVRGSLAIDEPTEKSRVRYTLKSGVSAHLRAGDSGATVLLLEGRPIAEPVVQHGPFVMNTREEIMQAFSDYRRTQFGGWPWPSAEPTHGGTYERFARFSNGNIDKPT